MKRRYVFEKGVDMPLCCVEDNLYFNYFTGEIIDTPSMLEFIQDGIKKRKFKIKESDLIIYKIVKLISIEKRVNSWSERTLPVLIGETIMGYIYVLDGYSNYLDSNKKLLNLNEKKSMQNSIIKGYYEQVMIWE